MALLSHYCEIMRFLPYATRRYRTKALKLLEMVHMVDQADRHYAVLAYGDLKRTELAIALAHNPNVFLMCKPTAVMAPKE